MANEPIREVVVNGNTYGLLADSAEVRDLLTAEDNTVFQFVKVGNKYGYRDANNNFIPFDKVQAGKTVTAGTSVKTVTPDGDYDGLASVTINPTPSQAKSITAATSAQTVSPDSGKLLSGVTVNPQPHTATRATVTSNGTIDLGANHATRYIPVNVPTYKVIRYVAVTKGNHAGGTVQVTRYDPDGTSETRTTYCNSNESAGWAELSVFAWEHWQYQFNSFGSVYLDGSFRQGGSGNFASYDSGDDATRTHTVEVLVKA